MTGSEHHSLNLPNTFDEPVLLGIIGGTGLYHLESLTPVARLHVHTPWGSPSSPITISRTAKGFPVAFLARHGFHHEFRPTDVPNKANIAALKHIGVTTIVAFSAVGSLQEHIKPRDFVIPNQVIDRTYARDSSFFEKGFVGHVGFGEPFDVKLNKELSKFGGVLQGDNIKLHTVGTQGRDLTLICMEGPAFSSRAESNMYRSWGGSVINMSCIPEAKLAKEAEISYQIVCMSTDYDSWRIGEDFVTVETVVANLTANSANANRFAMASIDHLEEEIRAGRLGQDLKETVKYSVSTAPHGRSPQVLAKLQFIFPDYWKD